MEKGRNQNSRNRGNKNSNRTKRDTEEKEDNEDSGEIEVINTRRYTYKGLNYEIKYLGGSNYGKFIKCVKRGNVVECQMFYKGVLLHTWCETGGKIVGKSITYERGIVTAVQDHDKQFDKEFRCLENRKQGIAMAVYDRATNMLLYLGDFNSNYEKHGKGTEYFHKTGNVKLIGVWENDKLRQVIKEFDGKEMIEYADGRDNMDITRRIPLYIGGYAYDEETDEYVRNGQGSVLNTNGKAIHEGIWKNGVEISGTDLFEGWYEDGAERQYLQEEEEEEEEEEESDTLSLASEKDLSRLHVEVQSQEDLKKIKRRTREIIITPTFDGHVFKMIALPALNSIEIGDSCLQHINTFILYNLPRLVSLTIGKNCSAKTVLKLQNKLSLNMNKSFQIKDCKSLKSIKIGEKSFIDFSGEFKISGCKKLETLHIGSEQDSWNFFAASFVIQSNTEGRIEQQIWKV